MKRNPPLPFCLPDMPRRRFLQGLAAGGVALGFGSLLGGSRAQAAAQAALAAAGNSVPVLRGTEFDLVIDETPVNYTGKARMATTINGSVPGPVLHWREGDTVTLRVTNRLKGSTSIHWHGILLPFEMDGVPGISYPGIAPGSTFVYRFKVKQAGTYWYHSHTGFQEQTGMYGSIIIEPAGGEKVRADRDYVVQLSDWTDENPVAAFAHLKKQSDYYNFIEPTAVNFFEDVSQMGLRKALATRRMWNQMRMSPADLADISAYTYTYLMNGVTPAGNWTGLFKRGERVRLRFINSGAMSFFDVRIPGLQMTVVEADGQLVEPVTVDELRIGVAETYDVIVEPKDDRAYTIFAQSMDRTGFARGTLAPRAGMQAEIPAVDMPVWLSMADMMGAMGQSGAMPGMDGMDHAKMDHGGMKMEMKGMQPGGHAMPGMSMGGMNHSAHAGMTMNGGGGMVKAHHARTEYGPSVDMRVDMPRTNLDDPGVGLRDNGRRVLTYADLHTIGGALDQRDAEREIELHLTGNMERYAWSLDGLEFGRSTPVHFRYGERLRVVFVNDTMMTHPMHLHGMWSEVETPSGGFQVRKHTVTVQPAQRVTFLLTADALGHWAWHCHLLYHMEAGMFREAVVA